MTDADEWVDAEWVLQQDAETAPLGVLTQGLAGRAGAPTPELFGGEVPLAEVDQLEKAVSDLIIAFEEGELDIEDTTDDASAAHLTTYRVHLRLRRSELKLAENTVATAVGFLARDAASGLVSALNLVQTLIDAARRLSAAERDAVSCVLANQRRAVSTRRDDLRPYGVDVEKLVATGILVESNDKLAVSA